MAFGDTVQTSPTGSGTSGEASATLSAGATAGNLLIFAVGRSTKHTDTTGNWGTPTGFTDGPQSPDSQVGGANIAGAVWWKIATGGETAVTTNDTNEQGNWCAVISEFAGSFAASPFDVQAEDESNIAAVDTSQSTGTTGTTAQADALAIAIFAADNGANVTDGRAYTNSFTEVAFANSGARASVIIAKKVLSATGAVESTFSTTDTGDEMYGAVMVFKQLVAAGGDGLTPGKLQAMGIIF